MSIYSSIFTKLQDIEAIGQQVAQIERDAVELRDAYAGDKAIEIGAREAEVTKAWRQLRAICDSRSQRLSDTSDLFRFMNMVRDLLLWMDEVKREMNTQERPKVHYSLFHLSSVIFIRNYGFVLYTSYFCFAIIFFVVYFISLISLSLVYYFDELVIICFAGRIRC